MVDYTPDDTTPASPIMNNAITDNLSITVAGLTFSGWSSVEVTRGIEQFPSSFVLETTEHDPVLNQIVTLKPTSPCTIQIGNDLVLTGYIEKYLIGFAAKQHTIRIEGRGKCCDLHDCSAMVASSQLNYLSVLLMAQDLAHPFGITVINRTSGPGPSIPQLNVNLGETPYEILERVCRWALIGFLLFENEQGDLVLSDVGYSKMGSGIATGAGGNVQSGQVSYDVSERYQHYYAVWQTVYQFQDSLPAADNLHGDVIDTGIPRYRPLVVQSEQMVSGQDLGQARVQWECNRRFGRSQVAKITVDSWRDGSNNGHGNLWQINSLVDCNIPVGKIGNQELLIASVSFRKDLTSGTTCDLVLMPKEAFSIEPTTLAVFDADVQQALTPSSQPSAPNAGNYTSATP